ncbi:hypothetical protein AAFC00_002536 [Neodothiora populina]|uniref:FCP1 homology domain-containing protein n=1 Tax=Neodothiora populina TaxID=2781224 RepID=A0ABR3P7Q9_9PEZI
MNALNILSGISSTPPPSPPRSRTASYSAISRDGPSSSREAPTDILSSALSSRKLSASRDDDDSASLDSSDAIRDEKAPLLEHDASKTEQTTHKRRTSRLWEIPKRISDAAVASLKAVLTTISAPVLYVVNSFYDEQGSFSPMAPIRNILKPRKRKSRTYPPTGVRDSVEKEGHREKPRVRPRNETPRGSNRGIAQERSMSVDSSSTIASESESEKSSSTLDDSPARNTRSQATASKDEIVPAKKSIRIKLHNEEALKRKRQHARASRSIDQVAAVANSLKSPSSPATATKLKYPRAPAAPRPLVPKRQPSYTISYSTETPKKTLILDLDETLIHSMAKGGRMSTGHMVEVKFQGPIGGNGVVLGPQVPILYYVHERPFCHDFLRKICKWYNLIVFTASVQEYADPVIDWLERERKYFSARYYRQHCTFRNGAYIKDLSQVEPDLSKVMILDNSPMSYIFHEDNAIPIEGWISDPTDNDLLHLVPLLEGLQYVTDVRALLALRMGQTERG